MKVPQDRKPPLTKDQRRAYGDVMGRDRGERLSEYFDFTRWPEKAVKPVTRMELLAILTREYKVKQASSWWNRIKVFMLRPLGSKPAVLATTSGEAARGEVTP